MSNPRDHIPAECLRILDALKARFGVNKLTHLDCPPMLKGADPYDPDYDRAFQLRKRAQTSIDIFKENNNG